MSQHLRRKQKCLLAFVLATFFVVSLDCQHPEGQPSRGGEAFYISERSQIKCDLTSSCAKDAQMHNTQAEILDE